MRQGYKIEWTPQMLEQLRGRFATEFNKDIAKDFGISWRSVVRKARELGLEKEPDFLNSKHQDIVKLIMAVRRPNPTKGVKGWCVPNSEKYRFKKGDVSANVKPLGCMVIRTYKHSGRSYIWVKCSNGFRPLHRVLWESANGAIPKGQNVMFKDNNPSNILLDNLELVSDADKMRRNTIQRFPVELKQLIRLLSKLKKEIRNNGEK